MKKTLSGWIKWLVTFSFAGVIRVFTVGLFFGVTFNSSQGSRGLVSHIQEGERGILFLEILHKDSQYLDS